MLRIAVISDLHASEKHSDSESKSHFFSRSPDARDRCPIEKLKALIKKNNLTADYLFCLGDIGDQAHPSGIEMGWRAVQEIKEALCATELFTTTGNHDVDSRHGHNEFDARGVLLALDPKYPLERDIEMMKYWVYHYVIAVRDQMRIVNLNSAAFHGTHVEGKDPEYIKGRIARSTIARLRAELQEDVEGTNYPLNILICHHSPILHSEIELGDGDQIQGGNDLLDLLSDLDFGRWLVLHGHKHHPKITSLGISSPVIFSVGSASYKLYPALASKCRNQFCLLEFDFGDSARPPGYGGTFKAWEWAVEEDWQESTIRGGLPRQGGFGWRGEVYSLADRIRSSLPAGGQLTRDELVALIPELRYVTPSDFSQLKKVLKQKGMKILSDDHGMLVSVGV